MDRNGKFMENAAFSAAQGSVKTQYPDLARSLIYGFYLFEEPERSEVQKKILVPIL